MFNLSGLDSKVFNLKIDCKHWHSWELILLIGHFGVDIFFDKMSNMVVVGMGAQLAPWKVSELPKSGAVCRWAEG